MPQVRPGEVYWLASSGSGHEQVGRRPVLVVDGCPADVTGPDLGRTTDDHRPWLARPCPRVAWRHPERCHV